MSTEPVEIPPSLYRIILANIKLLEASIQLDFSTEIKMLYLARVKNDITSCAEARS